MTEAARAQLLDRGRVAGFPPIHSLTGGAFGVGEGESSWTLAVTRVSEAELREANWLLDQREDRATRERDREERESALAAPPDPELVRRAEAQAQADLVRWKAGHEERVEQLLQRIVSAVEKNGRAF